MGLFNKLFLKKESIENNKPQIAEQPPFDIEYEIISDGRLKVEFYDRNPEFKNFYDTTRLIINTTPLNLENHRIYNCSVSWYGENDAVMFNRENGREEGRRADYRGVLAELDLSLLQNDPDYCNVLMKDLLDKKRVEKYLEEGLQENPQNPCGKYIGGVKQTENGYRKFFSSVVGRASHNSELMVERRRALRERQERARQEAIKNKEAQIQKLQREIEEM